MSKYFLFFLLLLSHTQAELTGLWFDENNNKIEISIAHKIVTGTYHATKNHIYSEKKFKIIGNINGDQISFSVDFEKNQSIQCWVGQHTVKNDQEAIVMLWHRTHNIPDLEENDNLWSSISQGKNVFTRFKQKNKKLKKQKKFRFAGKWQNNRNSQMILSISKKGKISGMYKTAVGEPEFEKEFKIIGIAKGNQISFCVFFEEWKSMTTWVGQCGKNIDGREQIVTMWNLGLGGRIDSVISGFSHFYRVE